MTAVFFTLFGSAPLWLKIVVGLAAVVALVVWIAAPPHWANLEWPDVKLKKRRARPPD